MGTGSESRLVTIVTINPTHSLQDSVKTHLSLFSSIQSLSSSDRPLSFQTLPDTRMSCVRITLLVTNLLMAVLGLLLIAGGVWLIVDESSAEEVTQSVINTTNFEESVKEIPGLDKAIQEVVTHPYLNYALIGMGVITFLVALFGFQGAKKESTCLLTTYSICLMLIIVLCVTAIVLINVEDDTYINKIKDLIKQGGAKIDLDTDELKKAGSKFLQSLFFGVAAVLSTLVLIMSILLCCRARREERVQGYVESTRA